jgi:hypothetical protein
MIPTLVKKNYQSGEDKLELLHLEFNTLEHPTARTLKLCLGWPEAQMWPPLAPASAFCSLLIRIVLYCTFLDDLLILLSLNYKTSNKKHKWAKIISLWKVALSPICVSKIVTHKIMFWEIETMERATIFVVKWVYEMLYTGLLSCI